MMDGAAAVRSSLGGLQIRIASLGSVVWADAARADGGRFADSIVLIQGKHRPR